MKPYVHSNYERKPDDNYQTIDPRCVQALIDSSTLFHRQGRSIIDCCSNQGSGIVDTLRKFGWIADYCNDAFDTSICANLNIFNPPYKRILVDKIIWHQIHGLEDGRFDAIAVLVRNNFDFAKSRYGMFTHSMYAEQVHMMFRPYWSTEKKSSPIHNFVWHIWKKDCSDFPIILYWKEK